MDFVDKDTKRITPRKIEVDVGRNFEVHCDAYIKPSWFHGSNDNIVDVAEAYTITVSNVVLRNAGQFYCYGLYNANSHHFLDAIRIVVYGKFHVLLKYRNSGIMS